MTHLTGEVAESVVPQKHLVAKLAEVMATVDRVPKRGWNDHFQYHYALEADILDAVRAELAARGVMLLLSVTSMIREEVPHPKIDRPAENLVTLYVSATWTDGQEELPPSTWIGTAIDGRDKGVYKAYTGAAKYILLKTFLIPTGDDPEKDDDKKPIIVAPPRDRHAVPADPLGLGPSVKDEVMFVPADPLGLGPSVKDKVMFPATADHCLIVATRPKGDALEVELATGERLPVYKTILMRAATEACEAHALVALERRRSMKSGLDYIVNITRVPTPTGPPPSDQPF